MRAVLLALSILLVSGGCDVSGDQPEPVGAVAIDAGLTEPGAPDVAGVDDDAALGSPPDGHGGSRGGSVLDAQLPPRDLDGGVVDAGAAAERDHGAEAEVSDAAAGGASEDGAASDASPGEDTWEDAIGGAGADGAAPWDAGSTDPGPTDAGPSDAGPSDASPSDVDLDDASADAGPADPDVLAPPDTGPLDAGGSVDAPSPDAGPAADAGSPGADAGPPLKYPYSWDGSFEPTQSDFPMAGLFDDEYFDGHKTWTGEVSPILPPGKWDWNDANDDMANWKNFAGNIGKFEMLVDDEGNHYGWRLLGNDPDAIDYAGPAAYFEGSPGIDVLDLGPSGLLHSFTSGNLGDGPDVLIFDGSWSLDFRTGSSLSGSKWDNDLVIGGCIPDAGPGYQFKQATIHTGPGSDWIFALDMGGAAIDAGNGDGGKTDVLDPTDGDDLVVLRGNMRDFRVFGGMGDDTAVWYVDEGKESIAFLGPNFFGGGGSGEAVWGDPGTDRLVLVVPPDTKIVDKTPTPPGALLVRIVADYAKDIWWDGPVIGDPFAKYCITCGTGPGGRKTVTLEYKSATTPAFTGYFWVTAFEELQLGVGPDAKMFRIDDVAGKLIPAPDLLPYDPPGPPGGVCDPGPWLP
ncbi:MAG: hypothetical protein AMXMBFR64_08040 [Myxococcales bacterium]